MTVHPPRLLSVSYDREKLRPRLLHMGFGAFAKAHVMVFHDEMLRQKDSDWGVVAVRLNSGADGLTELDASNRVYAVGEMSDDDIRLREIGAVIDTLHPLRDGARSVVEQISHTDLSVITLTITEKGYCLSGTRLDLDHPGIASDLKKPDTPSTAIGTLVEGLRLRRAAGLGGLTVLSCDNLPSNGHLCREAVLAYADEIDPELKTWIASECRFPCSMVDRITPAMTEASHKRLDDALGRKDTNGILCEPFRQWVIEDDFAGQRPDWNLAGAEFVADVEPFEEMKLRLLNGTHSFLAYLGALADEETIAGCMADIVLLTAARKLMLEEQAPTLEIPQGVNISLYADTLIDRFSNRALHHRTTQIAADGSQKLPQRLLAPIRNHLAGGRPWPLSALAIAGWMLYCRGTSERGMDLPLNDPLSRQISEIRDQADGPGYVTEMLSINTVFGTDLANDTRFADTIHAAYKRLESEGVLKALTAALQGQAFNT